MGHGQQDYLLAGCNNPLSSLFTTPFSVSRAEQCLRWHLAKTRLPAHIPSPPYAIGVIHNDIAFASQGCIILRSCSCAGKYMLAHAASAQGISAVENMCGRPHELNHLSVPAACFTHPEVSFVGLTEEAAREAAASGGFSSQVAVVKTSFKANSKARSWPGAAAAAALQGVFGLVQACSGVL